MDKIEAARQLEKELRDAGMLIVRVDYSYVEPNKLRVTHMSSRILQGYAEYHGYETEWIWVEGIQPR